MMFNRRNNNSGNNAGKVYLVGAGPGDPGLITVKGLEYVRTADVVVYDRLVHPDILEQVAPQAELIYVGKDSSTHTVKQEEINRLLANNAKAGKTVVRLKGGDPFVFGRGGEEAEFLRKEGLEVEIIPGVTAAVAVPAYAGIPVTHRSFCSSFGIITGHEDPQKAGSSIKWDKISTGLDTIVFLMGVTNLPNIVDELIKNGRHPSTPVAMIRWGTRSSQETLVGTLKDIVEKVRLSNFKPPAVTVVGEVVNLRENLRWFDNGPLFGKKILINRSRDQESRLAELLQQFGAKPIEFPAFITLPLESFEEMDVKLDHLDDYDWLFFTSSQGVQFVLKRLRQLNKDIRWLKGPKIGAIGNQTAEVLGQFGVNIEFQTRGFNEKQVIQEFVESAREKRILFFSAQGRPDFFPEKIRLTEARIEEVTAYRTEIGNSATRQTLDLLLSGEIDAVIFPSSNTVENFVEILRGGQLVALPSSLIVACIGPLTAQTAAKHGLKPDIVPNQPTIEKLVNAIVNFFLEL